MRTSRLEAFSDGVLAIIITIMVLELHEPKGSSLAALWHSTGTALLSYLLSFVYVGIYWTNHHHMFQVTDRVTGGILWANLGLLFCLSLFPFTTDWANTTGYARTPAVVYGVNLLAAGTAYYILQTVIIRAQGPHSPLAEAIGRDRKGKGSMVGYILSIIASLTAAGHGPGRPGLWVAIACYVVVAAVWAIPDRRIETHLPPELAKDSGEQDQGPLRDRQRGPGLAAADPPRSACCASPQGSGPGPPSRRDAPDAGALLPRAGYRLWPATGDVGGLASGEAMIAETLSSRGSSACA